MKSIRATLVFGICLVVLDGCTAGVGAEAPAPAPAAVVAAPASPGSSATLPPKTYSVAVDPWLAPGDVEDVLKALVNWQWAVPVHFDAHVGTCAGEAICIAYGAPDYTLTPYDYVSGPMAGQVAGDEFAFIPGVPYGQTFLSSPVGSGGRIVLHNTSSLMGDATFVELVEHEVGHAMGLVHHPGSNVMTPVIQDLPISANDVAQWKTVHGY